MYTRELEKDYVAAHLSGNMGGFETEHLCRWVNVILPPIIKRETWAELAGEPEETLRPVMGISMDPNGRRASAVLAWQMTDGRIAVRVLADVTGDPIDVALFGPELRTAAKEARVSRVAYDAAKEARVSRVAYDGATDAEFAKFFTKPEAITGAKFTNASSLFVNRVDSHKLVWDSSSEQIADDIAWTGRKTHDAPGTWTAIPLSTEHPVTAMLATIRAVWLASGPRLGRPRVM